MEETGKSLTEYLDIVRRRKYYFLFSFPVLAAISVVAVLLLPSIYHSEGVILIESQEIPQNLVRSTVTSYAEQQIQVIKQQIMTTNRIMEVIKKYNLYADVRGKVPTSQLTEQFKQNVGVEMNSANVIDASGRAKRANIAFRVSFMDRSATNAQRVANELVTLFLDENVKFRTGKATETENFLNEEAGRMQTKVQLLEDKIAEFKAEFSDSLPELLQFNLSSVERLEENISENFKESVRVKDQINSLNLELANIPPYLMADGSVEVSPEVKFATLEEELQALSSKYSQSHPDIWSLRREIASVKEVISKSGNVQRPGRQLNPLYRQIKFKIDFSEKELERMALQRQKLGDKLVETNKRVARTFQVKRGYDNLTRDYENTVLKYRELRAKQLEANVAQNMEAENKAESFLLIEPPLVPSKPVKPNRPKVMAMGLFASAAIGIGLMLLVETLDARVRGRRNIAHLLAEEPLVTLPAIKTLSDRHAQKQRRLRYWIVAGLAGLTVVLAYHFFVMNLDLLWFKLIDKVNQL